MGTLQPWPAASCNRRHHGRFVSCRGACAVPVVALAPPFPLWQAGARFQCLLVPVQASRHRIAAV